MPKIRKTVQLEIIETLDKSIFTSEDFYIIFGDSSVDEPLVSIRFCHSDEYRYDIYQDIRTGGVFTIQSPGQFEEQEEKTQETFVDAVLGIPAWCHELSAELKASTPAYEGMDELRNTIESQINLNPDDEDFSVAEINRLQEKFSALEEKIIQLEKENVITKNQLKEMIEALGNVSGGLENYPKKTWIKTATNKLVKVAIGIGKSAEGRKLLSDGARKLLGLD